MIGKLQVWKGTRKDSGEKIKLGGFISIDELQLPRQQQSSSSSSTPSRKKVPKPLLGGVFTSKRNADADLFGPDARENYDIPLFSNIPATSAPFAHYAERPPSAPVHSPFSPIRPTTAEARQPRRMSTIVSPTAWTASPPPLITHRERRDSSPVMPPERPFEPPRPSTSEGAERTGSALRAMHLGESATDLEPLGGVISLTPFVSPLPSSAASRPATPKSSAVASSHYRSGSIASTPATGASSAVPKQAPFLRTRESSILNEVEGTLTATITELQELQAEWNTSPRSSPTSSHGDTLLPTLTQQRPFSPSKLSIETKLNDPFIEKPWSAGGSKTSMSPESIPTLGASQSLPPSPLKTTAPRLEPTLSSRIHELEQAYDSQKRKGHSLALENEMLKKQISVTLKRIAETDAVRNERDKFERDLKIARHKLEVAKAELNDVRVQEEAAGGKIDSLEARLEDANAQKVDLLEANHDARRKMSELQNSMASLRRELAELRKRPEQSALDAARSRILQEEERNSQLEQRIRELEQRPDLSSTVSDLNNQVEGLHRAVKERDAFIRSLEKRNDSTLRDMEHLKCSYTALVELNETLQEAEISHNKLVEGYESSATQISELQAKLEEKEKEAKLATIEKDKMQQLLHAEFRRAAVEMHKRQHPSKDLMQGRMNVEAGMKALRQRAEETLKAKDSLKPTAESRETSSVEQLENLEAELHYHLTDILLYKLDVKGYRKDLRRAQSRIEELQSQNAALQKRKMPPAALTSVPSSAPSPAESSGASSNAIANDRPTRDRGPSISSESTTITLASSSASTHSGLASSNSSAPTASPASSADAAISIMLEPDSPATPRGQVVLGVATPVALGITTTVKAVPAAAAVDAGAKAKRNKRASEGFSRHIVAAMSGGSSNSSATASDAASVSSSRSAPPQLPAAERLRRDHTGEGRDKGRKGSRSRSPAVVVLRREEQQEVA